MAGAVVNYVPWGAWVAVAVILLPFALPIGLVLAFLLA